MRGATFSSVAEPLSTKASMLLREYLGVMAITEHTDLRKNSVGDCLQVGKHILNAVCLLALLNLDAVDRLSEGEETESQEEDEE